MFISKASRSHTSSSPVTAVIGELALSSSGIANSDTSLRVCNALPNVPIPSPSSNPALPPNTTGTSSADTQACYTGVPPVPSSQDPSRKRRRTESELKDLFTQFVDSMSVREEASVKPPSTPAALGAPLPDASSFQTNPQDPSPIAHSSGSQLGRGSVGSAPISDGSRRALSLTGGPPSHNPSVRDVAARHRYAAFGSYPCDFRSGADAAASIPGFSQSRAGRPPPPPFRWTFKIFSLPFPRFRGSCLLLAPWRISHLLLFFPTRPMGGIGFSPFESIGRSRVRFQFCV